MRVIVVGHAGKMGSATCEAVAAAPDLDLVGGLGAEHDLSGALQESGAEVVVDFTTPDAIARNLSIYLALGIRPVVGTTGLSPELLEDAVQLSRREQIGGVVASNFSIGAILMMQLAERAVTHLPEVEICEYHHRAKKDAPSGTSLSTRQRLQDKGALQHEVPIHSIRLDGYVASQEVIFGSHGERLTLRHDAIDRRCYMPGVLLAIRRCGDLREIVVGLDELL